MFVLRESGVGGLRPGGLHHRKAIKSTLSWGMVLPEWWRHGRIWKSEAFRRFLLLDRWPVWLSGVPI